MTRSTRYLATPVYLVSALIVFNTLMDVVISVWPPYIDQPRWRLGALGQLGTAASTLILAFVIAYAMSWLAEQYRVQRVLSVLYALMGVGLLLGAILLVLDMLQLRVAVRPEVKPAYDLLGTQALVKLLVTSTVALTMSFLIFRHLRALPPAVERPVGPVVVVGGGSQRPPRETPREPREVVAPPLE